jgi:hypothetical protein
MVFADRATTTTAVATAVVMAAEVEADTGDMAVEDTITIKWETSAEVCAPSTGIRSSYLILRRTSMRRTKGYLLAQTRK